MCSTMRSFPTCWRSWKISGSSEKWLADASLLERPMSVGEDVLNAGPGLKIVGDNIDNPIPGDIGFGTGNVLLATSFGVTFETRLDGGIAGGIALWFGFGVGFGAHAVFAGGALSFAAALSGVFGSVLGVPSSILWQSAHLAA